MSFVIQCFCELNNLDKIIPCNNKVIVSLCPYSSNFCQSMSLIMCTISCYNISLLRRLPGSRRSHYFSKMELLGGQSSNPLEGHKQ